MTCGIYCLEYIGLSSLKYVGQSIDINRRYTTHKRDLLLNKHHNYKLQEVYNTYKVYPNELVLEECAIHSLPGREVYWISKLNTFTNGFNLTKGGDLQELEERDHFNAKYPYSTYVSILEELANSTKLNRVIAEELNVDKRVVDSISCLSNHTYLQKDFPDLVTKMLHARKPTRYIVSPEGKVYSVSHGTGNSFAKEHGLDGNSLNAVLRGNLKSHKKWTRYNG